MIKLGKRLRILFNAGGDRLNVQYNLLNRCSGLGDDCRLVGDLLIQTADIRRDRGDRRGGLFHICRQLASDLRQRRDGLSNDDHNVSNSGSQTVEPVGKLGCFVVA